jgi:hypothetical protein
MEQPLKKVAIFAAYDIKFLLYSKGFLRSKELTRADKFLTAAMLEALTEATEAK